MRYLNRTRRVGMNFMSISPPSGGEMTAGRVGGIRPGIGVIKRANIYHPLHNVAISSSELLLSVGKPREYCLPWPIVYRLQAGGNLL